MVIDPNMNTTTPAMDHHTNLARENQHLQEKTQILYEQVELLTRLQHLRQEQSLHQHEVQNADSKDSAMKEDQDQPLPASASESEIKKHDAEKQLEDELKQDDSDVTLGREDIGEQEQEQKQEQENDGEPAHDKNVDEEDKGNDDKMEEDKENEKEEYSEEEHSSYANSEASDYEGPEPWTGDDLGGDPEDSDPENDSDDDMEDEDNKWGPWCTGTTQDEGPEYYQSRQSRSYFIAKYKRDKLHDATAEDMRLTENPPPSSTPYASGGLGECKLDRWLYFDNGFEPTRTDFNAYKSLYGLHPAILDYIEYEPTIRLLDKHAEIVSSLKCSPQQEFHDRFREFIQAFEKADYPSDYLEDDLSSEVARAHLAFCELMGTS